MHVSVQVTVFKDANGDIVPSMADAVSSHNINDPQCVELRDSLIAEANALPLPAAPLDALVCV
jgi:hypothetical protein